MDLLKIIVVLYYELVNINDTYINLLKLRMSDYMYFLSYSL